MSILSLLVLLAVTGGLVHVTRLWPRVASVFILGGGLLLVALAQGASLSSLDLVGLTFALEPSTRDLLTVVFSLMAMLGLASLIPSDRTGVSFLFWPWIPWVVALAINDFSVAVFAWALGMVTCVLAMRPRKYQRTSGAAFFLVLIVIATASLLLANRFIVLYPLTPEQTGLIQFAVLFLAWGMGVYFSILPFHLWVAPVADDAPLPILATILAFGQPIGLWLLVRLLSQYPWILDRSDMLLLFSLGGAAAILTGGLMAAIERREGRLLGYAAMFSLGFALMNVGQASRDGLAYAGFEIFQRGIALAGLAAALTVARHLTFRWVQRFALLTFLMAGLSLLGLRLGVSFAGRWNVLVDWAGRDLRLEFLVLFAHLGLLVGLIRFARHWHVSLQSAAEPVLALPSQQPIAAQEPLPAAAMAAVGEPVVEEEPVNESRPIPSALGNGTESEPEVAEPATAEAPNGDGNSSASETGEETSESVSEEYVFEAHVRELWHGLEVRWLPPLRRLARSLPGQTQGTLLLVWRSWRVWMSISLLLVLIVLLFIVGLEPGLWFNRIVESLGAPPFVQ